MLNNNSKKIYTNNIIDYHDNRRNNSPPLSTYDKVRREIGWNKECTDSIQSFKNSIDSKQSLKRKFSSLPLTPATSQKEDLKIDDSPKITLKVIYPSIIKEPKKNSSPIGQKNVAESKKALTAPAATKKNKLKKLFPSSTTPITTCNRKSLNSNILKKPNISKFNTERLSTTYTNKELMTTTESPFSAPSSSNDDVNYTLEMRNNSTSSSLLRKRIQSDPFIKISSPSSIRNDEYLNCVSSSNEITTPPTQPSSLSNTQNIPMTSTFNILKPTEGGPIPPSTQRYQLDNPKQHHITFPNQTFDYYNNPHPHPHPHPHNHYNPHIHHLNNSNNLNNTPYFKNSTTPTRLHSVPNILSRNREDPLGEHSCEKCGKAYKHSNCLLKHRWEHHESWNITKKWCQTKHQQVQMLEAAQVLHDIFVGHIPSSLLNDDDDDDDDDDDNEDDDEDDEYMIARRVSFNGSSLNSSSITFDRRRTLDYSNTTSLSSSSSDKSIQEH